jgi:hypothetical protein
LTSSADRRKISPIQANVLFLFEIYRIFKVMTPSQSSRQPQNKAVPEQCKHPRVQIVSRDEESEYVECKECGEVFESSELKDMAIEEKKDADSEEE